MKAKITSVFILFMFLYILVIGKAAYVQIFNRQKLINYSESQIVRTTKVYPKRGHILDRNENPLAINIQKYNLFTFAKDAVLLKKELIELDKILPEINVKSLVEKTKKRKKFTWIARKVDLDKEQVEKIKKFKSIVLEGLYSRFYPNHELLAQLIGFVGLDNDGLAGIEYQYNDMLKGEPLIYKYLRDAKGRPIKFKSANLDRKAEDLVLSIDKEIQASVEEFLKLGVEKHEATRGGAAVMDARTGEIWAIANYPSYDPNDVKSTDKRKLAFVTDPFEPGSTLKTITIASALENNIVRADTNYYCERGKFKVGNHIISESDSNHAYEWLSVSDILKYSSNIGTTKIAFDLTYPALRKTLSDFHIGRKTGIELSAESRGIMSGKENETPLRLSNISFGQGIAVTGIQMLASYAPFINGGYYVNPTIIKKDANDEIKRKKVIKKKTAEAVTKMLVEVVEDGTGSNASVPRFTIAGKTSTAQRADSNGGYSGYISGFIGYPVNVEKEFIVFVYVDNPKKGYYGNTVAAPIFQKIVKNILYKDKHYTRMAKANSKNKAFDNISIKMSSSRRIRKGVVPNLVGLDKTSAFKILDSLSAKYDHTGFGIVGSQTPEPGSVISTNTIIRLKFSAPKYE